LIGFENPGEINLVNEHLVPFDIKTKRYTILVCPLKKIINKFIND